MGWKFVDTQVGGLVILSHRVAIDWCPDYDSKIWTEYVNICSTCIALMKKNPRQKTRCFLWLLFCCTCPWCLTTQWFHYARLMCQLFQPLPQPGIFCKVPHLYPSQILFFSSSSSICCNPSLLGLVLYPRLHFLKLNLPCIAQPDSLSWPASIHFLCSPWRTCCLQIPLLLYFYFKWKCGVWLVTFLWKRRGKSNWK